LARYGSPEDPKAGTPCRNDPLKPKDGLNGLSPEEEKIWDDWSNSGPAIRLYGEGWESGPPKTKE
jgi:hypothetical protein